MVDVRLQLLTSLPVSDWPEVRNQLEKFTLSPDQEAFGGVPATFIDLQREPGREAFLVLADGDLVGVGSLMFGAVHPNLWPLQTPAVQVRGLAINQNQQGKGIGTEVSRLLIPLAAKLDPDAQHLTLTVNQRNPGARRAYEKAGFKTLPHPYIGGPLGPQDIMYVELA